MSAIPTDSDIDLEALVEFLYNQAITRKWIYSSANKFFTTALGKDGIDSVVMSEELDGAWHVLPESWREYFENDEFGEGGREGVLEDLARSIAREDFPESLSTYLRACRTLCLERTMSDTPILSHPLSANPAPPRRSEDPLQPPSRPTTFLPPPSTAPPIPQKPGGRPYRFNLANSERAGMSEKKRHEVSRMSELFTRLRNDDPGLGHVIDIGSGRGHLSRALALPPISAHVLAVDFDEGQKRGAERLDALRYDALRSATAIGSLTHIVRHLDKQSIKTILKEWPHDSTVDAVGREEQGAMLVGLHACGDLTVDTLRAFVELDGLEMERKMIAVGCCYTYLTRASFPISLKFASFPPLTQHHFMLSSQAPLTWYSTPTTLLALKTSLTKIAHRARLSAELAKMGLESCGSELSVGRLGYFPDYESYREKALNKLRVEMGKRREIIRFGEGAGEVERERAIFRLQVFWTLRSLIGPVVESTIILDRYAFLVEQLVGRREGDRRSVELIALFDQMAEAGSLRNMALVVR